MANQDDQFVPETAVSAAAADVQLASRFVTRLERLEAERQGRRVVDIRPDLARVLRTAPGTLANIRKQRRKVIPRWLLQAIRDAMIRALQAEVRALEHEIAIARQIGLDPREDAFQQAQASLDAAKALLEDAAR